MNRLMKWFQDYPHSPEDQRQIAVDCLYLAARMDNALPEGPEKTVGLRKLLEAKDAFLRAAIEARDE